MSKPIRYLSVVLVPFVLLVFSCAIKGNEETLELQALPDTLHIGITTPMLAATKKARDTQGRMQTTANYTDFYLVSQDSFVAAIVTSRGVRGVAAGVTSITARDNASTITSGNYSLTVTP